MKRGRILIFLGLILGVATAAAAFYVLQGTQEEAVVPTEAPKQKVLVALQNIGQANMIDPAVVELREFEQPQVPPDAVLSTADVAGKLAAENIVQGQIIRRDMLTDKKTIVEKGINASFLIPPGKVAVAFPIDQLSSVAYALNAGDSIDMLITIELISVDPETQIKEPFPIEDEGGELSGPEFQQIPRMVTQLTLQDVTILKIGRWGEMPVEPSMPEEKGQTPAPEAKTTPQDSPTIMTVLVDQQDALVLKFARESGASIDFALRGMNDHDIMTTEPVTLDYMIRRFNITPPDRLPYAIEMR